MKYFTSILGRCLLAMCACFGISGLTFADDTRIALQYQSLNCLAIAGHYGAESAKFQAEQTYMVSADAVELTTTGLLARESNGYRMAELVNTSASTSEVAKGKIGISAGAIA